MDGMLYAALIIGGLGLIFGVGLGIASKVFEVKVDPLVPKVKECLPGANCGGCGFAGCDAFAKALVSGETTPEKCGVNSSENNEKLASLLGVEVSTGVKKVAFVKCHGTCDNAIEKYEYYGIKDCSEANFLQGKGSKGCEYGCLGLGSCQRACQFDAIYIENGVAYIDEEKCTSCGMCVSSCPKNLIDMVPITSKVRVACHSNDKGKTAKDNCKVACIGCRMCVKACEYDAIKVDDFLATIDYEKCTNCGACVEKCPTSAIIS